MGRMARVEHILLESDERDVPTLETARRIHARIALPGGSWRPSLEFALIDYFYLSVRTTRARSVGSRYVVDLRFVDPAPGLRRQLPWSWIAAGAVFLALAIFGVREIAASTAPWWRHDWLPATAAFFAVATGALSLAVLRTTETLTLFSAYGRAKLVGHEGGAGTLRAFRSFLPRLEAHLRIACARRRDRAEHLQGRDARAFPAAEYGRADRSGVRDGQAENTRDTRPLDCWQRIEEGDRSQEIVRSGPKTGAEKRNPATGRVTVAHLHFGVTLNGTRVSSRAYADLGDASREPRSRTISTVGLLLTLISSVLTGASASKPPEDGIFLRPLRPSPKRTSTRATNCSRPTAASSGSPTKSPPPPPAPGRSTTPFERAAPRATRPCSTR